MEIKPGQVAVSSGITVAITTFIYQLVGNPDAMMNIMGEVVNSKITQAGFFFTVAAWLHAGRVKKEIASNFAHLTDAINNVAKSFREDLSKHSQTLQNQSNQLATLSLRVQNVENNLNIKKQE